MKTHFYNRTLLNELRIKIPEYFLRLDEFYDSKCSNMKMAYQEFGLKYPENIARRYADIKYYSKLINIEYKDNSNPFIASLRISSLLVGFYNSIKSFIDAIAITLNDILGLKLKPIDRDLCRKQIWKHLPKSIKEKYEPYISFFEDVKNYRNAASHRFYPNVMVCGPTSARLDKSPNEIKREEVEIRLIDNPDNDSNILFDKDNIKWISPLLHIEKWNSNLEELGSLIIYDIQNIFQNKI